MNETTKRIIDWIRDEPGVAGFLRGIAEGEKIPPHYETFEYGDDQLACWICNLVFPGDRSRAVELWVGIGGDDGRVDALYGALTEGRKNPADRLKWLDEMDVEMIRNTLLGCAAPGRKGGEG